MERQIIIKKYIKSLSREQRLIRFFWFLFFVVLIRLFILQVVQWWYYREVLAWQHLTASRLQAERWQIYVTDKAWTQLQMTENVKYFTLFIDPKFIQDDAHKSKIIDILVPITYDHLCVDFWIEQPTKSECVENIEKFIWETLLPEKNTFYTYSWDNLIFINNEDYETSVTDILEQITPETAQNLIRERYTEAIKTWIRERNYLWEIVDEELSEILSQPPYSEYTELFSNQFLYTLPWKILQPDARQAELEKLFKKYEADISTDKIKASFQEQDIRYIRLLTKMNAKITKRIKDAKTDLYDEKVDWIPLLHWLWLETSEERYYPHGNFMAHILWYVDKNENSYYWIEEYYDKQLWWTDWKIIWLATPWIGQIWANNFDIQQPKNWVDVYLTIDPVIQKELEATANYYSDALLADSVAITVLDPYTGKVKWMANAPTFDPNNYEKSYALKPLSYNERVIIDNLTYIDVPVFALSWDTMIQTSVDERNLPWTKKFIFENYLGPQVFVNKNISFPYEPWSVMKAITLWAWIDWDAINLYDFYDDPKWFVKIWPYTIANIDYRCKWSNTFMHALWFSCNVWMVRISQAMTKYVFYSYMKKLWFWRLSTIELANEEAWTLPDFNTVSLARYFNNSYWQWFLATPLQMATAYAALINWWMYVQPTIVEALFDPNIKDYIPIKKKNSTKVFKTETSELMKEALVWVIDSWWLREYKVPWISLWGKTWTSEIAFRWKYQWWHWRTNWSFVWLVTAANPNYVIAIQVRRPRISPWWAETAWKIFSQLADFLLSYDTIDR